MKRYNALLHGTPKAWDIDRKLHKGGGGGESTTVQEIPAELKPLASAYTTKALNLSDTFNPYQGQRYEDLNAIQGAGLGMATNRALQGSATMGNAENSLNQFIGGQTNPYLDAMYNQAAGKVAGSVNSNFSNAGRYGSGAHTGALTEGLGNMATNLYGGAYENDAARRMQAIGMAPTFGNAAYQDASQLLNAGQILQDQGQQNKDFAFQQYQEGENLPYKNLAAMSGVFGSNLGGVSKTTQDSGGK
jgi:hypothetical protein